MSGDKIEPEEITKTKPMIKRSAMIGISHHFLVCRKNAYISRNIPIYFFIVDVVSDG